MKPETINGMSALSERYDAFLVDQFGVLRSGRGPYPGAAEALTALKAAGKTVIILSNSGKRAAENSRRLAQLGFDPASWDVFLTSGEVAWRMLAKEGATSKTCLLISRDGDTSAIDGLGLTQTDRGEDAEVILLTASEGDLYPLSHYEALLAPAARRGIPCLCTNPDKVMLTQDGTSFGAGRIAELYEALGGAVRWIGKPFPDMYAAARELAGVPDARICCVGDSIEHDIAGAAEAGFASVLVTTGILAQATEAERTQLFAEHGCTPDYILPRFVWSLTPRK